MRKLILLIFFSGFFFQFSFAQQTTITGKIIDTSTNQSLENATICLLRSKDSILENFTRSKSDGSFTLTSNDTGKYFLFITYSQYADFAQNINIDGKESTIDEGKIGMVQLAHLLKDVIVSQKLGAIRIKGDTTEFVADSFKVSPNATVEDLLKKLPGFQVDNNGKITAQGQTVPKVLVDGEEFFGDDPTLVTKNLRADMIDKVQLYDKSSDQAAFTGIDDGNKTKTINLKLKEDKKNGYFGKLSGGIGTDKFKETQDMFNYFKGKRKISAYVTLANTGKTGLGFQDESKYGSSGTGLGFAVMDGGGIMISSTSSNDPLSSLESWNGNYDGKGIPNARTGGLHYDAKWNDDKQDINLNYKIGGVSEKGYDSTITQNNLPNGVLYTNGKSDFYKNVFRQKADGIYNLQVDSSSSLKFTLGGSLANSTSDNSSTNLTKRGGDSLVNNSINNSNYTGNSKAMNASMLWRKKFKKKGRTLSLNLNEYLNNKDTKGFVYNNNIFYNDQNAVDSTYTVDQYKTNNSQSNSFTGKLTYTEPLSKRVSLVANYGLDIEHASSNIYSYNKGTDNVYDLIDSIYSSRYIFNSTTNSGGLAMSYNKGKLNFNLGTDVGETKYKQTNTFVIPNTLLQRNFINWAPTANLVYKLSQTSAFLFNYRGSTQQPSITQIQPIIDNSNTLNKIVGNPLLKPSFNNSFYMNYNSYNVLAEKGIFAGGNYSFTTNPIVSSIKTNINTGADTSTFVNIGTPTSTYSGYMDINKKLKKIDLNADIGLSINGNRYANYINNAQNISVLNITNSNSYSLNPRLSKHKENKFDLTFNPSVTYNTTSYTLQNQIDNNYWSFNIYSYVNIFLPKKFEISTDFNYQWNERTQTVNTFHQAIWNAWVGKKFFKDDNLLLKLSCNDILNQNNGFSRAPNSSGGFQQTINSTIRRYFMLSLVWDFTKMGGGTPSVTK